MILKNIMVFHYILFFTIMSLSICAQEDLPPADEPQNESAQAGDGQKIEYDFFRGETTKIKDPFELRDPFKRKMSKRKTRAGKMFGAYKDTNYFTNLPSIDNVTIDKIKVVAVLVGKERRALVQVQGRKGETYILKEGMKFGAEKIELKAIFPGGIVFVEKIRNVYDQDEYLETIVPISTDEKI